ncbi:aryl-alcohol oxidase [Trichoderma cornu-damae]|uniref:Aryl-alcohol oxidase n=1 Tax=Trichoderma cornu-damae TaxID=654480 RepID=A0A9P8TUJ0_9HYPO|nr:aryl-alcohol oxidase [Trichoderma cornu-damae]
MPNTTIGKRHDYERIEKPNTRGRFLGRPISEPGEVTLNSSDYKDQPNINLNSFESELDIIAMRGGIRFSYDLLTKGERISSSANTPG